MTFGAAFINNPLGAGWLVDAGNRLISKKQRTLQ